MRCRLIFYYVTASRHKKYSFKNVFPWWLPPHGCQSCKLVTWRIVNLLTSILVCERINTFVPGCLNMWHRTSAYHSFYLGNVARIVRSNKYFFFLFCFWFEKVIVRILHTEYPKSLYYSIDIFNHLLNQIMI